MSEGVPDFTDLDLLDNDQSPLEMSFYKAADHLRKVTSKLNNNQLLEMYGLFKQGTEGRCNIQKPSWLDGKGRKKWEAWKALGDLTKEEAMHKYIAVLKKYDPEWSELTEKNPHISKETWVAVSSLRYSPEPELIHSELNLLEAAREDCADRVTQLLHSNPDLKLQCDEDGLTALHWAADRNATQALVAAIKGGCAIDATDGSGQTALHYAASCGHLNSTKLLVELGASFLKDNDDCTPLDLAVDEDVKSVLIGAYTQ